MLGKIKKKQQLQTLEPTRSSDPPTCALCHRPLGVRVEYHHAIPKSKGGDQTVPVHPICHRAIHARVSNHDLAATYADMEALRSRPDMQLFLHWITEKPPDFHAPTRRARDR